MNPTDNPHAGQPASTAPADPDRNPDGTLTDEATARITAEFDADFPHGVACTCEACEPDAGDFPLGQACSITDPDCEACQ